MPSLIITTPGTRVSLISERLHIEPSPHGTPAEPRDLPLADIERAVIAETCSLSTAALAAMLRRGICVIITDFAGRIAGLAQPPAPHRSSRLAHYRASTDDTISLALAALFVEAKILNSRRVLQRLAANRETSTMAETLCSLQNSAQTAVRAVSLDILRGCEGAAAAAYFEAYGTFFPPTAPFERRSRRPPHNPPNAILSYTYTLLAAEAESCLYSVGLDPALGFLHEPADRRPSLALDLIEPFRAPVADAMALDLLSHGTLHPVTHFERREGGIYLNTDGRRRFFVAYERRMDREFTSEQHGRRTTLRRELENQALTLKSSLQDGEPFTPFLMN